MSSADWDAKAYHRISAPQFAWGLKVMDRLALHGRETVLDAGCGTGRLTAELLERHPDSSAIALDGSEAMLEQARVHLIPRFEERVRFVHADLGALSLDGVADAVFSTATFHWVLDHDALLRGLFRSLRPGGRLVAQCGGAGNIAGIRGHARALMAHPRFASYFENWQEPWVYASAEETEARLSNAGFTEVKAWIEPAPTSFDSPDAYREYVAKVIVRDQLARLPDKVLRNDFFNALIEAAGSTSRYTLDYQRLNLSGLRRG